MDLLSFHHPGDFVDFCGRGSRLGVPSPILDANDTEKKHPFAGLGSHDDRRFAMGWRSLLLLLQAMKSC